MTPQVLPGAKFGEYYPNGIGRDTRALPHGYPDDLALFLRCAPNGIQCAAKGHTTSKIWLWTGERWTAVHDGPTPNFPVAFHPVTGELYVATKDVLVFAPDGTPLPARTIPGYVGSNGIRRVNADGSVLTGDATYGVVIGGVAVLGSYTPVAGMQIGQGRHGGIDALVGSTLRHVADGDPEAFVINADAAGNLAIFWTNFVDGWLLHTTAAAILALPPVSSEPPPPTPPPVPAPVPVPQPVPEPVPVPDNSPFDPSVVTFTDNPPSIASYAVTSTITSVTFPNGRICVDHTGRTTWPDRPFGDGGQGVIQYTLGLCAQIGGKWYGSAAIQFWKGRDLAAGGDESRIAQDWYYDSRWGALHGHQPKPGELVAWFVVAGNARGSLNPFPERSNFVVVPFGQEYHADAPAPAPTPDPQPQPEPPPVPPAPPVDDPRFAALQAQIDALTAQLANLPAPSPAPDLGAYAKHGDRVTVTGSIWGMHYVLHGSIDQ